MINFKTLYEEYSTDVYHFALWLTGDKNEAEDITSETFIRAWMNVRKLRVKTLKAYLLTIARNIYYKRQRKRNRQVALNENIPDPALEPGKQFDIQVQLKGIQEFLWRLPEVDRVVFVLRVQYEMPYSEIAQVMEISITSAKVKVHRIRKKLLAARTIKEVQTYGSHT
jgi:RNA polymerase sigma-70 factor (ECF subfamily)